MHTDDHDDSVLTAGGKWDPCGAGKWGEFQLATGVSLERYMRDAHLVVVLSKAPGSEHMGVHIVKDRYGRQRTGSEVDMLAELIGLTDDEYQVADAAYRLGGRAAMAVALRQHWFGT